MSIRLEMLEAVARGERTLDEGWHGDPPRRICRHAKRHDLAHGDKQRRHATLDFVLSRRCDDGGFRGRGDKSDLYYTTFAAQTLCAVGMPLPDKFRSYLESFRAPQSLGLVNLGCLIRCWACAGMDSLEPAVRRAMREEVYAFRSADGGFAVHPGQSGGSAYGCFLALSALQDLDDPAVAPGGAVAEGLAACVLPLRRPEGGFANESGVPLAMTPATAAAIMVLSQTDGADAERAKVRESIASGAAWLRSARRADGGFGAVEGIDSDLLSTATALHALASAQTSNRVSDNANKQAGSNVGLPVGAVERSKKKDMDYPVETPSQCDATRKYVLGLREQGGFCGSSADRTCDCEYTFYGLLALGRL